MRDRHACVHEHFETKYGGATWSRTKNVYHEGSDLQSDDAHALASIAPYFLVRVENFEISTLWLKARHSASELHPHITICLVLSCQFRSKGATFPKPMQLYQDQSPAALTRIVQTSLHDTLSVLNYNIQMLCVPRR